MPRLIARSMVSLGIFCALASLIALRSRALASGSPLPPVLVATVISLIIFVKILPRLASRAPFLCLIVCHLECPDILFASRCLVELVNISRCQKLFQNGFGFGLRQPADAQAFIL